MFDPTRYRYFLKPEKMGELKVQFCRIANSRAGDQDHLSKNQLYCLMVKQGFQIKKAILQYFDRELFKQDNKQMYSCNEVITLVDRLSINYEIQKQFKRLFKILDSQNKQKITMYQLKKTINNCNIAFTSNNSHHKGNQLSEGQLYDIFKQLDIDQDGLVSFEDFLCAMISK